MPERERTQRRQAERDGVRLAARDAYEELARREAERAAWLAQALVAASALHDAEQRLAVAVEGLVAAGMTLTDVAATVQVDRVTLERVMRLEPTRRAAP